MTVILSWNIQAGLGCDGVTDLGRIADTIRARDPDIICLQEVAQNVPDLAGGDDQVDRLLGLFAGYHAVFGAAIDRAIGDWAGRARFGNLILSRLPVIQIFTHPLPQRAAPGVKHMPRQATEIVADSAAGMLRIVTTHFEFHSQAQGSPRPTISGACRRKPRPIWRCPAMILAAASMPRHRGLLRRSTAATSMPNREMRCTR